MQDAKRRLQTQDTRDDELVRLNFPRLRCGKHSQENASETLNTTAFRKQYNLRCKFIKQRNLKY